MLGFMLGFLGCRTWQADFHKMEEQLIAAIEGQFNVKLRDFQRAVYLKVFQKKDVFVFAPTGSGKTFCFAFLSAILAEKNRAEDSGATRIAAGQPSSFEDV